MLNRISSLQRKLICEQSLMTCRKPNPVPLQSCRYFSTSTAGKGQEFIISPATNESSKDKHIAKEKIDVQHTHIQKTESSHDHHHDHDHDHDHDHKEVDDEMEQEDMFVSPDISLGTDKIEWGGPRRGGRYAEPTRFGDWERKGRCTDF
mmetsp:Transcript_11146/g.20863  ORF Transcript_11146/g.20863 Transcript_11146/m.20863 type:complete len:149 (-) Transcript_11146:1033-1479(-)